MRTSAASSRALNGSQIANRVVAAGVDAAIFGQTVILAMALRLGHWPLMSMEVAALAAIAALLGSVTFALTGVYRSGSPLSDSFMIARIGRSTLVYGTFFAAITATGALAGIPRTVGVIQPLIVLVLACSWRLLARRLYARFGSGGRRGMHGIIIYGAGSAGRQIAGALETSPDMRLLAFVDDDPSLHGEHVNGVLVWAPEHLSNLGTRAGVTEVLLAIPSASLARRREVIERVRASRLKIRTLPDITRIAKEGVDLHDIGELMLGDLLGRAPVEPRVDLLEAKITRKTVLVTGAGGSIGSELCRQVLSSRPAKLLLMESCEYALYKIHQQLLVQLSRENAETEIIPLLGSVTDARRVRSILTTWSPETIYHSAAYKHVPIVEHNPAEGARNNVVGTHTIATLAGEFGVSTFILVSTDKAVRPANIMGATKRAAELSLQALNDRFPRTCFSIVRFGNVLGSSGSVVPLFRQQIKRGGPVTVTDLRMTRYFMSIPEAAQLVIQAGAMASGGEVFVLDMGEPVRIADLARRMIELSGLRVRDTACPQGDIEIVEIGLRPGEKLFEELLIGDNPEGTLHPRILRANEHFMDLRLFERALMRLEHQIEAGEADDIVAALRAIVPEFSPSRETVDWVAIEDRKRMVPAFKAFGMDAPAPSVRRLRSFDVEWLPIAPEAVQRA